MSELTRADALAMLDGGKGELLVALGELKVAGNLTDDLGTIFAVILRVADGALDALRAREKEAEATLKEGSVLPPIKISSLSRPQSDFYRGNGPVEGDEDG